MDEWISMWIDVQMDISGRCVFLAGQGRFQIGFDLGRYFEFNNFDRPHQDMGYHVTASLPALRTLFRLSPSRRRQRR